MPPNCRGQWCDEEEIDRDYLLGLEPPKLDVKVVYRLTDDQCAALIKACSGKAFIDRRDEALIRLMLERQPVKTWVGPGAERFLETVSLATRRPQTCTRSPAPPTLNGAVMSPHQPARRSIRLTAVYRRRARCQTVTPAGNCADRHANNDSSGSRRRTQTAAR